MALHKILFDSSSAAGRADTHSIGAVLYDQFNDRLAVINASNQLEVHDADVLSELQGGISVDDGGGSLTVDAVDFDIRDLTAASDSVAAWLSDGSGNAITSTGNALDVNIASGSISIGAEYAEDSAFTEADVGLHLLSVRQDTLATSTSADGDYGSIKANSKGEIYMKDADVLSELQGGISVDDGGGSITVDAVDLDIRDLTAASDSVESWTHDGSGNAISSTGGSLDVNITNSIDVDDGLANTAIKQVVESVGTSAAVIVDGADELASRKYLMIYNNDTQDAFIGDSGVTTANGFPLPPGAILETRIGDAVDVYMIGDKAAMDIRTLQLS